METKLTEPQSNPQGCMSCGVLTYSVYRCCSGSKECRAARQRELYRLNPERVKRINGRYARKTDGAGRDFRERYSTPTRKAYAVLIQSQRQSKNVTVCARWQPDGRGAGYRAFAKDLGPRPDMDHRVLRFDPAKPHGPANSYWGRTRQPGVTAVSVEEQAAALWAALEYYRDPRNQVPVGEGQRRQSCGCSCHDVAATSGGGGGGLGGQGSSACCTVTLGSVSDAAAYGY